MIEAIIDSAVLQRVAQFGPRLQAGVERSIRQIVIEGQSEIVRNKLHGGTPLFSRSGNLARAVRQDVEADGSAITGTIGVDRTAPYGAVHEYGGTFDVREHISTSRLGNQFTVKAHSATYPERSFLRSWLAENQSRIVSEIEQAAGEAIR
jgi:phage gpG-like protein